MGATSWTLGLVTAVLVGSYLLGCNPTNTASVPGLPGQEPTGTSVIPTSIPTSTVAATTPSPTASPAGSVVSIGDVQFTVEVATTGQERGQGLSGRPSLAPGTGMLFVFEGPGLHQFWMIEMQFPLDFVWISDNCTVVDLTQDVPPPQPGQTPSDLPRYRPSEPVQYVLEINAGDIEAAGIQTGSMVAFSGELAGKYGC